VVFIQVETAKVDTDGNAVRGVGSGVILRSDGWIITNRHVVEHYKNVEVTLHDRRSFSPSNVYVDDLTDLAVLKIDERGLPSLPFGDPDSVAVGDWVLAFGHALGISPLEGGPTVTEGIVSSLGRSFVTEGIHYYDLVQISAAINPGNSGGPLVNTAGQIIGVNAAAVTTAQNIGYAIGIGTSRHVFEDFIKHGEPHHPYLGVRTADLTVSQAHRLNSPLLGALVEFVEPGSPAEVAGLRVNDVIVKLGDEDVTSAADLIKALWRRDVADKLTITYLHNGLEVQKALTLAERPETDSM